MKDEKAELKARIKELELDLSFYLLHYGSLIASGYPKWVLDAEIRVIEDDLKELGRWH